MLRRAMMAAAAGGGGGDPYWANVVSLLHFDGVYGSTTFTDQTGKTWTALGNAQIDTAQAKFGGSSVLFDGSGDYITTPHNSGFSIQAGDFTLEAWVYRKVSGAGHYLASKRPSGTAQNGWEWRINATNRLQFFHVGGSSLISSAAVPSGGWVHIATTRSGSTVRHFIDGVLAGSSSFSNGTENTADTFKIAISSDLSDGFNGWIDDFRITKGVARYTANFTPPTAAFPNS